MHLSLSLSLSLSLVHSIGKPAEAKTFGDLGGTFAEAVMLLGKSYQRIDIFFDIDENQSNLLQERDSQAKFIQ